MTTAADELRTAANKLLALTDAATPGPWATADGTIPHGHRVGTVDKTGWVAWTEPSPRSGPKPTPRSSPPCIPGSPRPSRPGCKWKRSVSSTTAGTPSRTTPSPWPARSTEASSDDQTRSRLRHRHGPPRRGRHRLRLPPAVVGDRRVPRRRRVLPRRRGSGSCARRDRGRRARVEAQRAQLADRGDAPAPGPCCRFWQSSDGAVHSHDCTRPPAARTTLSEAEQRVLNQLADDTRDSA